MCQTKNIAIPNTVSDIQYITFQYSQSLENITIPNGVERINEFDFSDCINLKSITLPDTITYLGKYAFKNCTNGIFYVHSDGIKQLLINNGINSNNIVFK